jgi:hypothetical protein
MRFQIYEFRFQIGVSLWAWNLKPEFNLKSEF